MPLTPEFIIIYILSLVSLISIIWIIRLEIRFKALTRGEKISIEQAINKIEDDLKKFSSFKTGLEEYLKNVEKRLSKSVQGVETINYSAFGGLDSGGRQSFATTLLNEKGDGIIISTLHSRDRVNVFGKEISNFKPLLKLSDEEQASLTKAIKSCKL